MAKSAGNFQRVTELAERGLDPLAFRYLVLTSRYGRKLNYSDTSLDAAAAALALAAGAAGGARAGAGRRPVGGRRRPVRAGAARAIDRPASPSPRQADVGERSRPPIPHAPALASRARLARPVRRGARRRPRPADRAGGVRETLRADLPADERRWLVLDADAVLGLDLDRVWDTGDADRARQPTTGRTKAAVPRHRRDSVPPEIAALVTRRQTARADRDFAAADALRDELAGLGWEITDTTAARSSVGGPASRGPAGRRTRRRAQRRFGRLAGDQQVAPPTRIGR